MRPLTETDIRASFVNLSKGEVKRLDMPQGFEDSPWADLDFLGWRDPGAPGRMYLVAERDGALIGIALRSVNGAVRGFTSRSMCTLCLTTHSGGGVTLMAARRTGSAGRQGNTVGQYLCADLACSLYIRGIRDTTVGRTLEETLPTEAKIERTLRNLDTFIKRVTG
ncbi:FBP domain-containing protein [Streptomyces avicenniae]|uniref:FBP domain-containing protein n=1 Tax=Streptomyces avicenniae TaxID=500153 RepID=UPI000699E3CF|nr:FBP domain-containing protein [Streptomyces avicenniae]